MLTPSAFNLAKQFIYTAGRKLDQRRFEFHFENGSAAAVLAELAAYQNDDGGFGHGLEPDLRTPASSAIATSQGFYILKEVDAPAIEPIVQAAVNYLFDSFDAERNVWPIVPPQVEDAPHAPWWTYKSSEDSFSGFLANPRAALLGDLYRYNALVPPDFLSNISNLVVAHLLSLPDQMDMHDLLCYQHLAESRNLPEAIKNQVVAKLSKAIPATVVQNPAEWTGYNLKPLDIIASPTGLFSYTLAQESIEANLSYDIKAQEADGGWPLAWSWADVDAQAWALAENDWRGYKTVEKLTILQAFGQIDGP